MRTFICLIMALSIISTRSLAQDKESAAVGTAVESLRKALIDPEKTTLDALVLDELTYGHSSGVVQDKATFEEALLSKSSDFVTIARISTIAPVTS